MQDGRCADPHLEWLLHLLLPVLNRWSQGLAVSCSGEDPHRYGLGREHSVIGEQLRIGKGIDDEHISARRAERLANRCERIEGVTSSNEGSMQLGRRLKLCVCKRLMCDGQDRSHVRVAQQAL